MQRFLLFSAALLISAGVAGAEQIRLRTGDFLQGEVVGERTDEEALAFRLYRTGGEFRIAWDRLIVEDEGRLREALGLTPLDVDEIPQVPATLFTMSDGQRLVGILENPEATSGPHQVRTARQVLAIPRTSVVKTEPTMVDALEVFTPVEMAQRIRDEVQPSTPSAWQEVGDRCMAVTAYGAAKEAYDTALADADFANSDRGNLVRNRLKTVAVYLMAENAMNKRTEIRILATRDRFDEALGKIQELAAEYAERPDILAVLNLDRLQKQISNDRREHFLKIVANRVPVALRDLVRDKVNVKDLKVSEALRWARDRRGLSAEIFQRVAEYTGLAVPEVMELWASRATRASPRHFNYGGATFMNDEVKARVQAALAAAKAAQARAQANQGGRNNPPRPGPAAKPDAPKTPDEWWASASTRDRENLVRAWFAEYGGVYEVLRIVPKQCRGCGGRGVDVRIDAMTNNEVRLVCKQCNLAGEERIVVAR